MTELPPSPGPPPKLDFDWRDWLPYIAEADLTETEKQELIETLWAIILVFVDLGWDVGAQTPAESYGQSYDLTAALVASVVNSTEKETL